MHEVATSEAYRGNSLHVIMWQWDLIDLVDALLVLASLRELAQKASKVKR